MRGSEWQKAAEVDQDHRRLHDCVVLQFKSGMTLRDIATRYAIEEWLVADIIRDHVRQP